MFALGTKKGGEGSHRHAKRSSGSPRSETKIHKLMLHFNSLSYYYYISSKKNIRTARRININQEIEDLAASLSLINVNLAHRIGMLISRQQDDSIRTRLISSVGKMTASGQRLGPPRTAVEQDQGHLVITFLAKGTTREKLSSLTLERISMINHHAVANTTTVLMSRMLIMWFDKRFMFGIEFPFQIKLERFGSEIYVDG